MNSPEELSETSTTCLATEMAALGDHPAARALHEDTVDGGGAYSEIIPHTLVAAKNLAHDLDQLGDTGSEAQEMQAWIAAHEQPSPGS